VLHRLGHGMYGGGIVGTNGKDKSAEMEEIFPLEIDDCAGGVVLDDIEDRTCIKAYPIFAGDEDLAGIYNSCG